METLKKIIQLKLYVNLLPHWRLYMPYFYTGYIQTELMTHEMSKFSTFSKKKPFNSYVYVSVDNDTMKSQRETDNANSHILENIVK